MFSPLIRVVKNLPFSGIREKHPNKQKFPLQKENFCLDFRDFSSSVGSHWPLAQNNPDAKEAYFGIAYSAILHDF